MAQPAVGGVRLAHFERRRVAALAKPHGLGAARRVSTTRRRPEQVRGAAVDRLEGLIAGGVAGGHGGLQAQGVGVGGSIEDRVARPALDDPSGVHHRHVVGQARHHAEIVGDKDDGHACLALKVAQKIQNLRLDGHVQGGGRLIGDQQGRFAGDGHGDHRPLQHPPGKLERILASALRRFGNARHLQQLDGPRQGLAAGLAAMGHQGFGDLVTDGHGRVE